MAYQVLQKRRFLRQYKKLYANIVSDVDESIGKIAEQPSIGERKEGIWHNSMYTNSCARINNICWVTPLMMRYASSTLKPFHLTKTSIATSSANEACIKLCDYFECSLDELVKYTPGRTCLVFEASK
jgi:hypothetical protein